MTEELSPPQCVCSGEKMQLISAFSARYRQLGNSIALPVFEWVAQRLVAVESRSPDTMTQ